MSTISICFTAVLSSTNPGITAQKNISNEQTILGLEFVSSGFNVDYKLSEIFGISAVIRNKGQVPATNIHWNMNLSGGMAIGKKASGTIPILYPSEVSIIKIPFIIGFGTTQVTAMANADNTNISIITGRVKITGIKVELLPGSNDTLKITLEKIADTLKAPTILTNAGDGSGRLFIAEQTGEIYIINNSVLQPTPFLDLSDKITKLIPFYDERGLLGLAFHPDYETNGQFYVYYTAPTSETGFNCQSVIAQYHVSAEDPDKADVNSEKIILTIQEPDFNHNGGEIAFGPDGYLYIGVGDGGGEGDEHGETGNGQNITTLLGKILRIDVDTGDPYSVPADNPFVGINGSDEIYAYGFRNPFRFSFDMETGRLFVGDVGQDLWEEIDIVENGGNYGWRIMEGNDMYDPALATLLGIDINTLLRPIHDYSHFVAHCVISGYVYRGLNYPSLVGKYVFGDWSSTYFQPRGKLFYLEESQPNVWVQKEFRLENDEPLHTRVLGFGLDEANELYVITQRFPGPILKSGEVWHIVVDGGMM